MGFGLLFIGYFMASVMSLNTLGGVFSFFGFLLVVFAAKKLMAYDQSFLLLLIASVIMAILSAVTAVSDVSSLLYRFMLIPTPLIGDGLGDIFLNVRLVLDLGFTAVLCYCVRSIGKQTEADKIPYLAIRNFVFFCISFVLQVVVWLASNTQWTGLVDFVNGTALPIWTLIINIVCLLLNCLMLFSCYSKICDASDVDMPQKPSRFAFVNRRREERERSRLEFLQEREKALQKERAIHTENARKKKK